ncbi:MAG: hypothetical protein AAB223_00070, partial [Pseudomonadota bacterium]
MNGLTRYVLYQLVMGLVLIALAVPAFMFLKSVAGYVQNYLMSWIGQRISQELREDLFTHL